ncbi:hypothetical protein ABT116_42840, partial [Streptomyces sp. NPDC002130]
MLQRIVSALAALVLALGLGFIVSSNAVAAPTPMGGGSGIIIDNQLVCTLTTIGHDNGGRLVGITAGHCGGPGSFVIPESNTPRTTPDRSRCGHARPSVAGRS